MRFTMMGIKQGIIKCIIGLLIVSCEDIKEEQLTVDLEYNHNPRRYQKEYPEANFHRHNIVVNPNVIDTDLDSNMSARVNVPLNVDLSVDYKSFTTTYPDIYYEYGSSDPFVVTYHSPSTVNVGIRVSVNPNYPIEETETIDNTTIDNTTIDNVTLIWSDNFTYNVSPTQEQKTRWVEFLDNMSNDNWSSISIGNPDNMTTCDNATLLSNVIAETKENANYELLKQSCNDMFWNWGICYNGREISAYSTPQNDCRCATSGYTLRPSFFNKNWGGVGKACNADNQTLQVILQK